MNVLFHLVEVILIGLSSGALAYGLVGLFHGNTRRAKLWMYGCTALLFLAWTCRFIRVS